MSLRDYGWNEFFSDSLRVLGDAGLEPGRVILSAAGRFRLAIESGECQATPAGKLRHASTRTSELPAVGDWVAMRGSADGGEARIEQLLARRTKLSRKVAGRRFDEQVVAANVDLVGIVMGLDGDFNLRRLERLLTTAWESGARPLVLLNKLDLCRDPQIRRAEVEQVAAGAPVLMLSCLAAEGIGQVRQRILPRMTAVLIGSSGVGKSTLINRLLGESVQKTETVRPGDDRGRHTTTNRELFRLPDGGLLIDSPGIRELQLWADEASLTRSFEDVAGLARRCRFRDCAHSGESGCAVLEAVESGSLPPQRLESYRSLRRELRYLALRQDESAQRLEKRKWRTIHKEMRRSGRHRKR